MTPHIPTIPERYKLDAAAAHLERTAKDYKSVLDDAPASVRAMSTVTAENYEAVAEFLRHLADPPTTPAERAIAVLTDVQNYGGVVAYSRYDGTDGYRCVVVYGIPCFVMPNGKVRVGDPNSPMVDPDRAVNQVNLARNERALATPLTMVKGRQS